MPAVCGSSINEVAHQKRSEKSKTINLTINPTININNTREAP